MSSSDVVSYLWTVLALAAAALAVGMILEGWANDLLDCVVDEPETDE